MSTQSFSEKRSEPRYPIDSINLPFIGSREADHHSFQYLLSDMSLHGAQITIPKWLVGRERLQEEDIINFHVPFRISKDTYDQGKVAWKRWDSAIDGQVCGARMINKAPLHYPVYIRMEAYEIGIDLTQFETVENLLVRVVKDSGLLKRGVFIYLRHLIPYFSRISDFSSDDYRALKSMLLDDVLVRVERNQEWLQNFQQDILATPGYQVDIARHLDLEELREVMESEIYFELFRNVFSTSSALPYLEAIKELEKRLYANYNTIVMIYLQSL
ncbi:MAG: hypothetical protein RBS57_05435 [Desulforhabdus sp.]|jgi:hypothetical protein|nr:hypothetical protein [Desulforhabdus sp.]